MNPRLGAPPTCCMAYHEPTAWCASYVLYGLSCTHGLVRLLRVAYHAPTAWCASYVLYELNILTWHPLTRYPLTR